MNTLKIHRNGWGKGTPYKTYEEYWEFQVIVPLILKYQALTGRQVVFADIQRLEHLLENNLNKVSESGA